MRRLISNGLKRLTRTESRYARGSRDAIVLAVATVNHRLGHPLNLLGVVLTRVDGRNVIMNTSIRETISGAWGELVFDTEIGVSTALAKAQHAGEPIFTYDERSRGAKDYAELTDEVLQRLQPLARTTQRSTGSVTMPGALQPQR